MKSTKFEIQAKSLMLNSYIWEKDDLSKNALKILDSYWPLDPMRLLGVRMSTLKSQQDIKKEMNLTKFFEKQSADDYQEQQKKLLEQAKKNIVPRQLSRDPSEHDSGSAVVR